MQINSHTNQEQQAHHEQAHHGQADHRAPEGRAAEPESRAGRSLLPGELEWDELYSGSERIWSDNPNAHLATTASELPAGNALDLGCGEGIDVIWLAEHGWTGTGIDISNRALERASRIAQDRGVSDRISWIHADAREWFAQTDEEFDLISAQFFHLPAAERNGILRAAADHVRVGGTLLIVGHTPPPEGSEHAHRHGPDFFFTADQIVAIIADGAESTGWAVDSAGIVAREIPDPRSAHSADAVVRLRRLPAAV